MQHPRLELATYYQYLELTFYEVKYPKRFQWYVNQLPQWCSDNGGTFLGGTSRVNQMMGMTRPNYITVTQWKTEEDYAKYHGNADSIFDMSESACIVQALVRLNIRN
ncbi:hypothetical protein SprV_0100434500 [Sparganum proliferum]